MAPRSGAMPIGRDVIWTAGANAVSALAALAGGLVLAKWLGPAERGRYEVGLFAANSAVLLLGLGLTIPTAVLADRHGGRGVWAYRLGLKLALAYAVIGIGVAVLADGNSSLGGALSREILLAVLACLVALLTFQLVGAGLLGWGAIRWQNVSVTGRWLLFFGLTLSLWQIADASAEIALGAYAAATLAGCVIGWTGWTTVDRSETTTRGVLGWRASTLLFGLRGQVGNILQFASYRFDVVLITIWVGASGAGVYAVGVMFAEAVLLLPKAVGTVLLSHTARSHVESADARIGIVFPLSMLVVSGMAVMAGLSTIPIVRWYLGAAYQTVPTITWLLIPGTIALSGTKILANELTARGYPGVNSLVSGGTTILVLCGDVLLIPWLGVVGASVASSIGYCGSLLMIWRAFRMRSGAPLIGERDALWVAVRTTLANAGIPLFRVERR